MKNLLLMLAACLLAVSCVININGSGGAIVIGGCSEEGITLTDTREVAPFRAINSRIPCNVYYSQSETQEVRVETTEEFAEKVLTEVNDGTLDIRLKEGKYHHLILRVVVSSPEIESMKVSGSGNLIHEGVLQVKGDLDLRTSGSGVLRTGDIVCDEFTGKTSGSGSVRTGRITCTSFSGTTSGSGSLRVEALSTKGDAYAHVSGSGGVYLNEVEVDGDMTLSTSGSGSIKVDGKCRNVTASTSGSGSISGNLAYESIQKSKSGSGSVSL